MSEIGLDRVDRKILNLLQSDARMTNAELAEKVSLSPSACLRRVQRLEKTGVIDSYVTLVNQAALGLLSSVFVEVTLDKQSENSLDAFEEAVRNQPEIMECYLMAGDADYILHVLAKDPQDYERIHRRHITRLPGVLRIKSSFTLRAVCKKTKIDFL